MADPATQDLTPTVRSVLDDLGPGPVTAQQIVEATLRRHEDYGGSRDVDWPRGGRAVPVEQWIDDARALFDRQAHAALHGRILILGAGLADPPAGAGHDPRRALPRHRRELTPSLWEGLTPEGRDRLDAIPILLAAAGFAIGSLQLGVPVAALTFNDGGNLIAATRGLDWIVFTRSGRKEVRSANTREPVIRLAFAADGRLIVGTSQRAGVVQVRGEEETWAEWAGDTLAVGEAAGDPVAASSDLLLARLTAGTTSVLGEGRPATAAVFADRAPRLARAEADGSITLWDLSADSLVERFEGGTTSATAIAISARRWSGRRRA